MGTKPDGDVQVQVQPIVGTIPLDSPQIHAPVQDRWPQNLQVYTRWQPHVQGEQEGSDVSSSDTMGQQPHVQGEQQGSASSPSNTVDLPIALRKETREAARKGEVARKALCEMHALQTVSDEHDISKFVSYESLGIKFLMNASNFFQPHASTEILLGSISELPRLPPRLDIQSCSIIKYSSYLYSMAS
jgi:hypothetical protein